MGQLYMELQLQYQSKVWRHAAESPGMRQYPCLAASFKGRGPVLTGGGGKAASNGAKKRSS